MTVAPYVLITPAHNEADFIERVLESMVEQKVLPLRWVIVDDASTDGTAAIVESFLAEHDFIRLVRVEREPGRHFGNKVNAFNRGCEELRDLDYEFIGNLDADVSFPRDYFENLLEEFQRDPRLGVGGGLIYSWQGNKFESQGVSLDTVCGSVQLFRRHCYEEVGGYEALPLGGVDTAIEIKARMHGWRVRTFPEHPVREHRWTGWAAGDRMAARVKEGRRLHSMGYDFGFFCVRCVRRSMERPWLIGSFAALWGFLSSRVKGEPVLLAPDVVHFLREEQRRKLRALFRGAPVIEPPAQPRTTSCAE